MALLVAHGFSVPAQRRRVLAPAAEVAAPVATRLVAKGSRQRQLLRPALSAGDEICRHSTTMHGGCKTSEKDGDQDRRRRCITVRRHFED